MPAQNSIVFFLSTICLMMVLTGLKLGQDLFGPMLAAVVLGVVCAPFADRVERLGVPRVVAALLVLAVFLVIAIVVFFIVEPAVTKAIRSGPLVWRELTNMLEAVQATLAGMEELKDTVSDALNEGTGASDGEDEKVELPGTIDALAYAPYLAAALMIFVGTIYFFLVARTDIYDKIDRLNVSLSQKVLCAAESRVSRYFLTITIINAAFGGLVTVVLTLIGLPGAIVWGLVAFLANFILYLGPAVYAAALVVAGLIQFDGAMQFAPAALFVAMNMIEGQFVTPTFVSKQMSVNPLLVFVSLAFWLWLWGPIGGLVAIPVLVWSLDVLECLTESPAPSILIDGDAQGV